MTAIIQTPASPEGVPVYSPTTVYCPEDGVVWGVRRTAALNSQNIWDTQLINAIYLQGGGLWICNAIDGDYGELAVVDKDDILGLFQYYGLVKGVDVLELRKHVRTLYFPTGNYDHEIEFETKTYIPAGLYLREIYMSVGTTGEQPIMAVHYKAYEV
jgi:hypothetical protein